MSLTSSLYRTQIFKSLELKYYVDNKKLAAAESREQNINL